MVSGSKTGWKKVTAYIQKVGWSLLLLRTILEVVLNEEIERQSWFLLFLQVTVFTVIREVLISLIEGAEAWLQQVLLIFIFTLQTLSPIVSGSLILKVSFIYKISFRTNLRPTLRVEGAFLEFGNIICSSVIVINLGQEIAWAMMTDRLKYIRILMLLMLGSLHLLQYVCDVSSFTLFFLPKQLRWVRLLLSFNHYRWYVELLECLLSVNEKMIFQSDYTCLI